MERGWEMDSGQRDPCDYRDSNVGMLGEQGAEHPSPCRVQAEGEEVKLSGWTEARMAKTLNSIPGRFTFIHR